MKFIRPAILCLLSLLLLSCVSVAPAPQKANDLNQAFSTRLAMLSRVTGWTAHGAIAIRNGSDAWSANVHMQQSAVDYYRIDFIAPLGAGTMRLVGSPSVVTFTNAKGQTTTASTPEALLERQMGWTLPVTDLYYWLRGIPAPDQPAQKHFDKVHHLTRLVQQGWTIIFERYTGVGSLDLPSKIIMQRQDLSIKLIINKWQDLLIAAGPQAQDPTPPPKAEPKITPLIDLS